MSLAHGEFECIRKRNELQLNGPVAALRPSLDRLAAHCELRDVTAFFTPTHVAVAVARPKDSSVFLAEIYANGSEGILFVPDGPRGFRLQLPFSDRGVTGVLVVIDEPIHDCRGCSRLTLRTRQERGGG